MRTLIYFIEIEENNFENDGTNLLRFVSEEKKKWISRYYFPVDRKLSLYTELLVRRQTINYCGLHNDEIAFHKNQYGKPYLANCPNFHFNISHTRNAITVAFSEKEIGVDVERMGSCDLHIVKRFFTPSEGKYINGSANMDKAFYEIWTKKEAYIKSIGTGLYTPLKSFCVLEESIQSTICFFEKGRYLISACCQSFLKENPSFVVMTEKELEGLFTQM